MPDSLEFAEEQKARRFSGGPFVRLTESAKSTPISDAGALYRQKVRQIMCAGEVESSTWIPSKRTRFDPTTVAVQRINSALRKSGFGVRRGARARPLAETFVQRAQRLDKGGHRDAALDLIYDSVDVLMRNTEFPRLDSILANVRVSDHSVDVLLGILTATLPARSHLPSRAKLFKDIEKALRERGENEEGLLTGLEGDRASWQTAGLLVRNGASSPCAANEQGGDAATAAHQAAWQKVIEKLTEWARNPKELEDDRLEPPDAEMIQRAIDFARALQQGGYPPPTNVVPDANGGIVFHRREKDSSEEFHFWDDGTIDYCRFHGTRMVARKPL